MSLLIRPAVLADASSITRVFLAARRAAMPWLAVLCSNAETRRWIRATLLRTNRVWVAEERGQIVGFAGLSGEVLEPLYVHPAAWGQGIGSRLLETVRTEPLARLALSVFQRNVRARRFYEAQGFKLLALGSGADNDEGEPDARYEWHRPAQLGCGR